MPTSAKLPSSSRSSDAASWNGPGSRASPAGTNTSRTAAACSRATISSDVGAVAHQARRQVRHDRVALARQPLDHGQRGVEPLGRRRRHGHLDLARHVREHLLLDPVDRQDLVARVLEQRDQAESVTVCSSVKVSITWLPPTRPMPLSVPARPPNGRCASQ